MFEKIKGMVNAKMLAFPAAGTAALIGTSVSAFASPGASGELPTVAITTEMLNPLVEGVVANISVILPVGLGLFAIMIGIRIIPSLINRFLHG